MMQSSLSSAEKRDLYMKAYTDNKREIDKRIAGGIEKNRMGCGRIRLTDKAGNPIVGKKITLTQKSHDFKYGANIFMLDEFEKQEDNEAYRRQFKEHFNLATVPFYWDALEPEEGAPRYNRNSRKIYRRPAPDLCVDYCAESGILPKLHCLVYDKYAPGWLKNRSLEEVKAQYEQHIRKIAERYAGKMYEYEVINEQLEHWWSGQAQTELIAQKDIVEWSFDVARKYFPNETLVINEGSLLEDVAVQGYYNAYSLILEKALLKGASIDKIGIQNHLFVGAAAANEEQYERELKQRVRMNDPTMYFNALDILADFGLPLEITEVTVPTFGNTQEDEELQADMLRLWYSVWFSHPAVETIVYWNTVDGYAYESENWNENNCRGGLFHHDLTPKKSALMLKKLFSEIWHTDLELITDKDGYADFSGFYGEYLASCESDEFTFTISKNQNNCYKWRLK